MGGSTIFTWTITGIEDGDGQFSVAGSTATLEFGEPSTVDDVDPNTVQMNVRATSLDPGVYLITYTGECSNGETVTTSAKLMVEPAPTPVPSEGNTQGVSNDDSDDDSTSGSGGSGSSDGGSSGGSGSSGGATPPPQRPTVTTVPAATTSPTVMPTLAPATPGANLTPVPMAVETSTAGVSQGSGGGETTPGVASTPTPTPAPAPPPFQVNLATLTPTPTPVPLLVARFSGGNPRSTDQGDPPAVTPVPDTPPDTGSLGSPDVPIIGDVLPRVRDSLENVGATVRNRLTLILIIAGVAVLVSIVFGYLVWRRSG